MSCSICNLRKEKRFCLAVHGRICAQCCGEQREVTLDCPSECPYLQQARQHEKPRTEAETPPEETFPAVHLQQSFVDEHEQLMAGILQTLGKLSSADRGLNDRAIINALVNMARSYQTLTSSGLVYQEPMANPAQQVVIAALQRLFEEYRAVEQHHRGYSSLKDREVLNALIFTLRLAHVHTSGRPLSRGFLDFLHERFASPASAIDPGTDTGSRIILP